MRHLTVTAPSRRPSWSQRSRRPVQAPGAPDASIFSRERATRPRRRGEGPQGCCLLPILTVRSGLTANCQVCRGILHLKRSGQDPLLQESARIVVPMKQIALSLVVIAGSGAYVWQQSTSMPVDDVLGPAVPSDMADRHSGPLAIPATSADPAASPAAALPDLRPRLEPRVMPAAIGKETTASITPPKPDRQKVGVPRFPQASPQARGVGADNSHRPTERSRRQARDIIVRRNSRRVHPYPATPARLSASAGASRPNGHEGRGGKLCYAAL